MADLKKIAKSAAMLGGRPMNRSTGKGYDTGLTKQYFAEATQDYTEEYGDLASNCYDAECQGLDSEDFYTYRKVKIRVFPAASSRTGELMPDDWQEMYIIKPTGLNYVPQGAYLTFAGNKWLVYKGKNVGTVLGSAIIRRCNSVINVLDWYGNIVSVPMSFSKMATLGNASHASENSIIAKNYISCICQKNEYSSAFAENTRMILGKAAYSMRGLNDFTREFTDEPGSIHLLTFTIERSEPLEQDSIELQCADYFSFSWDIRITAATSMRVGSSQQLNITSVRMGTEVNSTEKHPISYAFSSSDPDVMTVSESGIITAAGIGTATITATLVQNPKISKSIQMESAESGGTYLAFTNTPIHALAEFEEYTVSAALFQSGEVTDEPVTFTFTGAPVSSYEVVRSGKNGVTIRCYIASTTPLTIGAESGGERAEMIIWLTSN